MPLSMGMDLVNEEKELLGPDQIRDLRHDLRNPINAIIGYSEIWLEDLDPQEEKTIYAFFDTILKLGEKMLFIIHDLLAPEKVASPDPEILAREITNHLDPLTHQVMESCARALAHPSCFEELASDLQRIETAVQTLHHLCQHPFQGEECREHPQEIPGEEEAHLDKGEDLPPSYSDEGSILVVDDNTMNCELLSRQCQRLGYSVQTAADGVVACALLEKNRFDLVLLDIVMPNMSGIELLKHIRKSYSFTHLPVIMVTARDDIDDIVMALEIGANDYITKPFALPVVTARVKTQLLVRKMVSALETANAQLQALSFLDGLTGISNRRRFDHHLQEEWNRMKRRNYYLSLIMADIDHFKSFNDTYGHEAGDGVLKQVAVTLNGLTRRSGELVARYGGEEFAVILPEISHQEAMTLAERMRQGVADLIFHDTIRVTISAGVCTTKPHDRASPVSLISYSDQFLYQAKDSGRNRVEGGQFHRL